MQPLASPERFGSRLVQLLPRPCGEGSQLDSLQPKNLLLPGPLQAPLPPTDAGGGTGWVEERAAEHPGLILPGLKGSCCCLVLPTTGREIEQVDISVGGNRAKLLNGLAGKGGRDG